MNIIHYLLQLIQYLYQQNCWLINFICRYIPLKQWAFDDSHSPKYQKFKIDELPLVTDFRQDWTYKELIPYYEKRYEKKIHPVSRRSVSNIPNDCSCLDAMPRSLFSTKTMGPKASSYAKSAARDSLLGQQILLRETPMPPLWQHPGSKERTQTLYFTQMCQPRCFPISGKSTRMTSRLIMGKINTNCIISTMNSRWIFSAWI